MSSINALARAKENLSRHEENDNFLSGLFGSKEDPCGPAPSASATRGEIEGYNACKADQENAKRAKTEESKRKVTNTWGDLTDLGRGIGLLPPEENVPAQTTGGTAYDIESGPPVDDPKILGMPKAVFWSLFVILLIVIVYVVMKRVKK